MSKRTNPYHSAQKATNKAKFKYAEKNKKEIDADTFDLTEYYIRDGLRFVKPYYYTFKSFVKGRWVGAKLKDMYCAEFRGESEDTLLKRFSAGKISVNGNAVSHDYVIKHNDFLEASMHRHEMPVKGEEIEVVHEDENFLVVNKPASIPVHPAGRFRYNSLLFILGKCHGIKGMNTIHRLDRLTSGCQILAKNVSTAQKCFEALKNREVSKQYVTGLHGNFPDGHTRCDAPIGSICSRIGIFAVLNTTGQESVTLFDKVCYDKNKDISFVICRPLTGRTHQIRVHARHLGHPVINDPLYNSEAWSQDKGQGLDGLDESERKSIIDKLKHEHDKSCGMEWRSKMKFAKQSSGTTGQKQDQPKDETSTEQDKDPICEECQVDFEDPPLGQLEIYLHAYKYSIIGQNFEAPLPHWAGGYKESIEKLSRTLDSKRVGTEEAATGGL